MDLTAHIRDIPDFPKPGILFKDITPLLAHPEAFGYAIDRLADYARTRQMDILAAAEARGFLLAAPLAYLLKKPLVPLRKPGKLPYQTHSFAYDLEYGQATLHVHVDAIPRSTSCSSTICWPRAGPCTPAVGCEKRTGGIGGRKFLAELGFLGGREPPGTRRGMCIA